MLHLAPSSVAPFHTLGAEVALRVAYCGHRPVQWCARRAECQSLFKRWVAMTLSVVPPPDFYRPLRPRPDNKVGKVTQVNRAVVQESTHSAQVSWFISLAQEQSLYPGRPRGGLTIVPSRHLARCRRSVSFEALGGLAVPPPALAEQAPTPQPHHVVL